MQNSVFRDLSVDLSEHIFDSQSPKIAFKWTSDVYYGGLPNAVGNFSIYEFSKTMNKDYTYNSSFNFVPFYNWTTEQFPFGRFIYAFDKNYYYSINSF